MQSIVNAANAVNLETDESADYDYFSLPGLSNSGMKDLAVSPLRYWHKHINPNRPKDEPTPQMQFGSAVHCAVLEPEQFNARYARALVPPEGCLFTVDDLRKWIESKGGKAKGTRKAEVIAQAQAICPDVPILDVLQEQYAQDNAGKVIFTGEDWERIQGAKESLLSEPRILEILNKGKAEVPVFVTDPDTGVLLKAKMDWVTPTVTLDLKTFAQKQGKSIDRTVTDAILYERYYVQAYFYTMLRTLNGDKPRPDFVLAFVESEPPHEVRLRLLRPQQFGQANVYWEKARLEVRNMIQTFAEYSKHFGERPWRDAQEVAALSDEEMLGMAY